MDHNEEPVIIQNKNGNPGGLQWVDPLDMPDVTLQACEDFIRLMIYGWDNTLPYYYVVVLDYNDVVVVSDTIPGSGTSYVYLPDDASGDYTVNITTSRGDEYTGTFYVP